MIDRLWRVVQTSAVFEAEQGRSADACVECGQPSLPAAGRCGDCLNT